MAPPIRPPPCHSPSRSATCPSCRKSITLAVRVAGSIPGPGCVGAESTSEGVTAGGLTRFDFLAFQNAFDAGCE